MKRQCMQQEARAFPLFAGDPALLAKKLNSATGLLGEYWSDFQQTSLKNPATRADMLFLPALVNGEGVEEARKVLRDYYIRLPQEDCADDVQFHTWCRCGVVTRRAAFFDWLAYHDAWSDAEIEEAAECFLGFAFKHAYPTMLGRARTSNNQVLGMALHCAVVGYLFGHKLCQHPTGKFLFEYGMGRLPDVIGLFPQDGYGGEGSTYTSVVNSPLIFWTCEFLNQVTGRDWFETPFEPNGTTLRSMLEMELRITSPGGLLAPWDHYGWQRGLNASPYAYLARATGDPRHLSLIPSLDFWVGPGALAWGADDPLWTLLWWPEAFKAYNRRELPSELFGWFLPKTGAALDDPGRRARLMQVWDASSEGIAGLGRSQTNPNHLMFDYAGEPVFQDGIVDGDHDPWGFTADQVLASLDAEERDRLLAYYRSVDPTRGIENLIRFVSPGLIGAANAIVVDEEPWYWPGGARIGVPEWYSNEDGVQSVAADCASFYQPHYDVEVARRTSLWSKEGFGVVCDTLRARSPHTWRWQVHLRPEVELKGNSVRVRLPNGKHVLLAWEAVESARTTMVEGFPQTQEKRCCRLDLLKTGSTAAFTVVIAPDAASATIKRVDAGTVEVTIDGQTHRMAIPQGRNVKVPVPDVYSLSDIEMDFDVQFPDVAQASCPSPLSSPPQSLGRRAGRPSHEGNAIVAPDSGGSLSAIDACLEQLVASRPDVDALLAALHDPRWPVQVAATTVLGQCGCQQAASVLRALLEAEHATPVSVLYPPAGAVGEVSGKRWRLKVALIVALGRVRDRDSVPVLGRILADHHDFYPVHSVVAQALGRIGGPDALPALAPALKDGEDNTQLRAKAAQAVLEVTVYR